MPDRIIHSVIDQITGLRPTVWVSVGSGYSREDIKSLILSQGRGLLSSAIVNLEEICLRLTQIPREKLLGSTARIEILQFLLAQSRVVDALGAQELRRIRRQRQFYKKLDQTIQDSRMTFAHEWEESVFLERTFEKFGDNPLRHEVRALASAYEAWLKSSGYYDQPLLIREAVSLLQNQGWPTHLAKPKQIIKLSVQKPESLELSFWEALKSEVELRTEDRPIKTDIRNFHPHWQCWHTLEDAAEHLADQMLEHASGPNRIGPEAWSRVAILIPDIPSIRRSLNRALEQKKIPAAENRDPTRLRWDEGMKEALLPLEVVAKNFDSEKVIAWVNRSCSVVSASEWVQEIYSRGIRDHISSYNGGNLVELFLKLQTLLHAFGGRKTCAELKKQHLRELLHQIESKRIELWIPSFFDKVWGDLEKDLEKTGQAQLRAPILFWFEKLTSRIRDESPPAEPLKPKYGVQIYRLQQAPVGRDADWDAVYILGIPPMWFQGNDLGDYWWSDRDRELLSSEFAVRSRFQIREERLNILAQWMNRAKSVTFLSAHYSEQGKELESIFPVIKELEQWTGFEIAESPEEMGVHPRFLKSYQVVRPVQPMSIQLPGRPQNRISATTLDRFSRCSFQAMAYHRWNVRDIRLSDIDLWPDVKGNILHEAARILVKENFSVAPSAAPSNALARAWHIKKPKGLIRAKRVEQYVQKRLLRLLDAFCEKEKAYREHSKNIPLWIDDHTISLDLGEFSVIGKPDRVDQNEAGFFVMDYKTSGLAPHGSEMIHEGYRLQLPIYALALQRMNQMPVIGVQFIEFDRKNTRSRGVFFKAWNGKEEGNCTNVRSNSKSLIDGNPEEVWESLEDQMIKDGNAFLSGRFAATPRMQPAEKECSHCRLGDLCGVRRRVTQ